MRKRIMELSVTQNKEWVRFKVEGDIDEGGAEALKRRFQEMKLSTYKEVVFDFDKVTYIGSAGIGKLLIFYKNAALCDCEIRIENIPAPIYELFMVLKLDSIFTIIKA